MKKWVTMALMLVMCLMFVPMRTQAAETVASGTCGDNLMWTLDGEGTLTISGTGEMQEYSYGFFPWYQKKNAVKNIKIEEGVTSIYDDAFNGCNNLKTVTIPGSVTNIGNDVFRSNAALTGIWVDESNLNYSSDEYGALFNKSKTVLICAPGAISGVYTIPNGVTTITDGAFTACSSLTDVTIPDSVTHIGTLPFQNCSNLTGIRVDKNNQNYSSDEYGVLFNKDKTTLVCAPGAISGHYIIPNSVSTIDYGAFIWCVNLTTVTIPNSVTEIGDYVFYACFGLTSITVPDSVTSLGSSVFTSCKNLVSITIQNCITEIGEYEFSDCGSLTSITIPDSVTSIGEYAFYDCKNLKSIVIPTGVKFIGEGAFEKCSSLWHVLYKGTEIEWEQIDLVATNNTYLRRATTHYICTGDEVTDAANEVCTICFADCTHTWDSGEVTKAATCKEEGIKTYTCTVCSGTKTEAITKLTTHTPGSAATATTDQTCTFCGAILVKATGETEPTTPPTEAPTEPYTQPTDAPAEPVDDAQEDDGFPIWIPIVIVVVAGGAAVGVILWKKKH